ncbi:uncharacterized protein LOC111606181 [Xiphophorus maculatus]|uniref:uncharacterized protein LOC111606181 n=1 Tax=Xiphophorus maculatus TaxID=8083 RepID=UPI000C6E3FA4|nr:uncharacterized protein LOC111606181 [Xiphophorus maculatus]
MNKIIVLMRCLQNLPAVVDRTTTSIMFPRIENTGFHLAMHAGSIVLAIITQIISEVFFYLAKEDKVPNAVFQTSSWNVSKTFSLELTMDSWSENFWIWIDLWSKMWLVYAAVSLFRRNVLGPQSCNPEIHPPKFFLMWTIINITRVCSMPMWDRHYILPAVLSRWILPLHSFYMLFLSYSNLNKHKAWLAINNPGVIPWTRYLTQNGLAVFAWWSLFHSVVGFGIVLKYYAGVQDRVASATVLFIISVFIITWFILQNFFLVKYMWHTFSIYAILILGLGAMFTSSYSVQNFSINTAFCGVLMLLITIMSFIHLISACLEKSHKPVAAELRLAGCETVCKPEGNIKAKLEN